MAKLQKVVTASEQDRIVLSERLEAARVTISDLKKNASTTNEKMSGLSRTHEETELRCLTRFSQNYIRKTHQSQGEGKNS